METDPGQMRRLTGVPLAGGRMTEDVREARGATLPPQHQFSPKWGLFQLKGVNLE